MLDEVLSGKVLEWVTMCLSFLLIVISNVLSVTFAESLPWDIIEKKRQEVERTLQSIFGDHRLACPVNRAYANQYTYTTEGEERGGNEEGSDGLSQRCAVDLCGAAKDNSSGYLSDSNFDQYVQEGAMARFSEVEKELNEMIEVEFVQNDAFIKAIKEELGKGRLRNQNFDDWEANHYDNFATRILSNHIIFGVDRSKPFNERVSYEINFPKGASETFKKGIEEYAEAWRDRKAHSFIGALYMEVYTIEEATEVLKGKWNSFFSKYEEKKQKNPDFLKEREEEIRELREKIEKGEFNRYENIEEFLYSLNDLNLLQDNNSSSDMNPLCQNACQNAIREKILSYDYESLIEDFEKANRERDQWREQKLTYCRSAFAMRALRDDERRRFKTIIPQVKELFLKNVLAQYSDQTRSAFENYLDENLNVTLEMREGEIGVESFIKEVKESYKAFKETSYVEDYSSFTRDRYIAKLFNYTIFSNHGSANPLSGSLYYCKNRLSSLVKDQFTPDYLGNTYLDTEIDFDLEKDNIRVSPFSCFHPGSGKSIFSHELGHALSHVFSKNQLSEMSLNRFRELRECAKTLYKTDISKGKPFLMLQEGDYLRQKKILLI